MAAGIVTINIKDAGGVSRAMQFWSDDGLITGNLSPVPHDAATATKQTELAALIGEVQASPTANTLLDRLKTIAANITTMSGYVDGLEALATSLNGYVDGLEGFVDGLETLQGTTNTTLTTLNGYVDGLEALATSLNGYVDGLETLQGAVTETAPATDTASSGLNGRLQRIAQRLTSLIALLPASLGPKAGSGSLSIVPATDAGMATSANQATEIASLASIDTKTVTYTEDAASAANPTGTVPMLIVDTGGDDTVSADGDNMAARCDANGQQYVRATDLETLLTTANTTLDAIKTAAEDTSDVSVDITASELHIGQVGGYGFDVVVAPTVTNGAYSAGDIVGGLLSFDVARVANECVLINEIQIALKAAVTSSFTAVIFTADPTSTTKTDNAAYSLNAADVFKVRRSIPPAAWTLTDHGTPNTYSATNLNIVCKPAASTTTIYMLLIDGSGFTLTSTADIQIRMTGTGV